ncbi:MAG: hypothetical protein IT463_00530 [Planctomycetes bacterium]|nr:hypothetical protein [Planctomycetota bacterium]
MLLFVEYLPTVAFVAAAGLVGYVGIDAGVAWWRRRKVSPSPVVPVAESGRGLVGKPEPLRGVSARNIAANTEKSAAAPDVVQAAVEEKDSSAPCAIRTESDCAPEQEVATVLTVVEEVDFGQGFGAVPQQVPGPEAEVVLREEFTSPILRGADTERCPSVPVRFGSGEIDELHKEGDVCNNAIPLRRDPSVRVFDTTLDRVA